VAKSRSESKAPKRAADWRRQDPHYQREKASYGRAVPSREFLQQYLAKRDPMDADAVCGELGLEDDWSREAIRRRLGAMARDGQLVRNRRGTYGLPQKMDLIAGRVIGHPEGFGFLVPEEGGDDLYLPARVMRSLMHGDRALVSVAGLDRRGRREGKLVEVLERNTKRVVGRYHEQHGVGVVVPDNRRLFLDILVPQGETQGAQHGQIVTAEIVEYPTHKQGPIGTVAEVLGDHMAPGMEVEIALRAHDIRTEWPEPLRAEIADLGEEVPESAKEGRVDLRSLALVTIDGITAKDFDDAVFCQPRGERWRLVVAIADVSAYVSPGTALDGEAKARGTSVYFPDRVIPMLPEGLSNGLCSLNPKVDRLCMACDMTIDGEGEIVRARFVEAVMRSQARLTYDTVARVLLEEDERLDAELVSLVPHLKNLHALYKVLRAARDERGAIDFETQETVIEYGPERKIERIVPSERNEAHMLIEECMIAANVAAARLLRRRRMPALYRVHNGPTQSRVEELRSFLGELGLFLPGGEKPSPHDYGTLLERAASRPDFHLIQTVLLRSLSRAVYAPGKDGHFGLALPAYAHFTSPIRRYPDLLVHRAIRHLLRGGKPVNYSYSAAEMERLGEQCSTAERNADEAVWDAIEWLKCEYMLDHVGEEFPGLITSVTSFGLFVELKDVFVEGLVHVTALANDYYHFDPVGRRLTGERSGAVYRLGDSIRVKVAQVTLDDRRIDFEPVGELPKGGRKGRRGRKGR
jgi:ribonuclease R